MAIIGLSLPLFAQVGKIASGVANRQTFKFYWETRLEPSTPEPGNGFSGLVTSTFDAQDSILRVVADKSRGVYLGYEVKVEVLDAGGFRVTFREFPQTAELVRKIYGDQASTWTRLPTPGWGSAAPQTVRSGDVITLTLLTNGTTGQKIVDYVTVQEPERPAPQNIVETLDLNAVLRMSTDLSGVSPLVLDPKTTQPPVTSNSDLLKASQQVNLSRTKLALAELLHSQAIQKYEAAKKSYDVGSSTLRVVLEALQNVNDSHVAALESKLNLAKSVIELQKVIRTSVPRQ